MNKINISSLTKIPIYPQLNSLLEWIYSSPKSFRTDHSLEIFNHGNEKNLGIKTHNPIKKNDYVFLVSTIKCITGLELVDCSPTKTYEINKMADRVAEKYYQNNPSQYYYTMNLIKILIQLFVHSKDKDLSLHPYAKFLTSIKIANPLYWKENTIKQIFSNRLNSLILNTHAQLLSFKKDFEEWSIFGLTQPELIQYMCLIRSRNLNFMPQNPKFFSKDFIAVMCPIVDLINHSFRPNCKLEGEYVNVDAESFVVVRATEDIEKNEELMINYGDYPNYDFLMKFGFLNKNNPFNELKIELNYDEYLNFTEQQFDLKKKIMRTVETLNLEEIALFSNKINDDILKMLRIYFLTNDDIMKNTEIASYLWKDFKKVISKDNERKICEFMIETLMKLEDVYKIEKKKFVKFEALGIKGEEDLKLATLEGKKIDYDLKTMLQFCLEEEELIQNNLNFFHKKLNGLL